MWPTKYYYEIKPEDDHDLNHWWHYGIVRYGNPYCTIAILLFHKWKQLFGDVIEPSHINSNSCNIFHSTSTRWHNIPNIPRDISRRLNIHVVENVTEKPTIWIYRIWLNFCINLWNDRIILNNIAPSSERHVSENKFLKSMCDSYV